MSDLLFLQFGYFFYSISLSLSLLFYLSLSHFYSIYLSLLFYLSLSLLFYLSLSLLFSISIFYIYLFIKQTECLDRQYNCADEENAPLDPCSLFLFLLLLFLFLCYYPRRFS